MKTKPSILKTSASFSAIPEKPTIQAKKRFGKKVYIAISAIVIIAVIVVAVLLVPPGNADVITLGVHYSPGEKLTYAITTSTSSQYGNTSTNLSAQSTLTIEVISLNGDTYNLNYTTTSSSLGYSFTTSRQMEVKQTDIVNLLTLLPVALQQYTTNSTSPMETAVFNQTTAKVGDTWQIPLNIPGSNSTQMEITVKFVDIQNLAVKAGTFKVFRIDFSQTNPNVQQNSKNLPLNLNYAVSGTSYLEFGTSKQIQSTLELTMTSLLGITSNSNTTISFTSTLTQDSKP